MIKLAPQNQVEMCKVKNIEKGKKDQKSVSLVMTFSNSQSEIFLKNKIQVKKMHCTLESALYVIILCIIGRQLNKHIILDVFLSISTEACTTVSSEV